MKKVDLLVIGGGPAGLIAAVTAKKNNPEKKVLLVRKEKQSIIPCGIPYVFNRLKNVEQDILPDKSLVENEIEILVEKIEKIDFEGKIAKIENKEEIIFEKLILAIGSKPVIPSIEGIKQEGIWFVNKNLEYLKKMKEFAQKSKRVVIVGGGYIGVEFAEEFSSFKDKEIILVERLGNCLGTTMDKSFSNNLEESLKKVGVEIKLNTEIIKIEKKGELFEIILKEEDGISTGMVIIAVGARPNIKLVEDSSIEIAENGSIKVDNFMQTNLKDIYAIGDCAEKKCLISKASIPALLASTACYEARIAGNNVFKETNLIENIGTLASFSTMVNDIAYAVTGLTENAILNYGLEKEEFDSTDSDISVGEFESACHHPAALPETSPIKVKLLFRKSDKLLVGAQLMGPEEVGEMINVLALGIQKKVTAFDLARMQVATHPLLTPAPTVYPLIIAAQKALKN